MINNGGLELKTTKWNMIFQRLRNSCYSILNVRQVWLLVHSMPVAIVWMLTINYILRFGFMKILQHHITNIFVGLKLIMVFYGWRNVGIKNRSNDLNKGIYMYNENQRYKFNHFSPKIIIIIQWNISNN